VHHLFRLKTRRPEHDEAHQPKRTRLESGESRERADPVASTGVAAAPPRDTESEWPWWLSSPTEDASNPGPDDAEDIGRRWSLEYDESDEPTSLPAA
jgi:hypothetical protein